MRVIDLDLAASLLPVEAFHSVPRAECDLIVAERIAFLGITDLVALIIRLQEIKARIEGQYYTDAVNTEGYWE